MTAPTPLAPTLFDPATADASAWPDGACTDRAYLTAFARLGAPALISNLRTQVLALRSGERVMPVTVNEAEYGDAYVCLPHSAYALYAKAELGLVDAGRWAPALGWLANGAGGVMRAARLNKVAHIGNWMLSTNLHGAWRGDDLPAIRARVIERFPDHLLAVRSLSPWSNPRLLERFGADGWRLLPARQIWVTDNLAADWAPRRDTRRDLSLAAATPYRRERIERLQPGDAERIAELYGLLYLQRYSALNPAFTPAFIEMTHRCGLLRYEGFRDADGRLASVVGCIARGGVLTAPIVGYDTARPAAHGLYRLSALAITEMAAELGARLNGSAGAADFKRNRGARGVIEYTAVYDRYLSAPRRAALAGLQAILQRALVPLMKRRGL